MDKKEEKIFTRYKIKIPNFKFDKINNSKNFRKIIKIGSILIIASIVVRSVVNAVMPIIDEQCKNMASSIATKISNEEATKVMANYEYADFCNIIKDENNNIKMISVNMITINEVISDIPIRMQEELEKEENNTFTLKLRQFYWK